MIIIITGFRLPALVFKPGRGPPELVHLTLPRRACAHRPGRRFGAAPPLGGPYPQIRYLFTLRCIYPQIKYLFTLRLLYYHKMYFALRLCIRRLHLLLSVYTLTLSHKVNKQFNYHTIRSE